MNRLSCLIILLSASHLAAAERPNVLLVIADDQTWNLSGCYGHPDVKTPNIDALAAQGMRLTHCFTATAMCSPTRQQLYTGLFPVRNGAYPNHSRVKPGVKSLVHYFKRLGYRVGLAGKRHIGPPSAFAFEKVGGGQLDFQAITEFVTRDATQPYFLVVASHSPHLPWNAGDASQYDPDALTPPPYLVDTPQTRAALTKYYAEISDLDRELGRCTKIVDDSGAARDTILIYTSEQGAQFPHGKWTCYDVGLRTAMVVRWPRRIAPGSTSGALVQYVDVVPTLLEAAGAEPPEGLDGRSFLGVLTGERDEHHEHVYGVHTTRGIINGSPCYPIRSVRSREWKLIWNLKPEAAFSNVLIGGRDKGGYWHSWVERAKTDPTAARLVESYQRRPELELYRVADDAWELTNLADAPEHRGVRDQLKEKLDAWMAEQGDRGIETELAAPGRRN